MLDSWVVVEALRQVEIARDAKDEDVDTAYFQIRAATTLYVQKTVSCWNSNLIIIAALHRCKAGWISMRLLLSYLWVRRLLHMT